MKYSFYNREAELQELISAFQNKVIKKKSVLGYIVQGRENVGKSRLIKEFLHKIEYDVSIHSDIPKFEVEKHVITYTCNKDEQKPYLPFIKITEELRLRQKYFRIIIKVAQIGLAILGINDTLNAFNDLINDIKKGENKKVINKKETIIFNKYRKFIKKMGKNTPIIIFIENVQWIDIYSLNLIQKLVYDSNPLWGMIILEEDDTEINKEIQNIINQFIFDGQFARLNISALDMYFPSKLLASQFGNDFFSNEENEILFTRSKGCPGILIDDIKYFIKKHWLIKNNETGKWSKIKDIDDKIKPPSQMLVETITLLYEDHELSDREMITIKKMAVDWDISDTQLSSTINMITNIMDNGFKIIQTLGPGIVSRSCFVAINEHGNHFIIEYLKHIGKPEFKSPARNIHHSHLLDAKEVKKCKDGVLILWDYFEGKRARQVIIEAIEKHIGDNVRKMMEISAGLAELHRNNQVHGFIKPESIIILKNGSYQLATFDISIFDHFNYDEKGNIIFGNYGLMEDGTYPDWENLHYISPEQLENSEPTPRSDIFAIGVIFYKSLTNRFPFHGRNKQEIIDSIKNDKVTFHGYLHNKIPDRIKSIIKHCLVYDPANRYANASEFYKELSKVEIKIEPEPPKPPIPPTPKHGWGKIKKIVVIILILVLTGSIIYFLKEKNIYSNKSIQIIDNITVDVDKKNYTKDESRIINQDVIRYLIIDDIMQSSNEKVLTLKEFKKIYPENKNEIFIPHKEVKVEIINRDFNYQLKIKIKDNKKDLTYKLENIDFNNPSQLLKGEITNITKKILEKQKLEESTFTDDWDAFIAFYQGEKAWLKLDKNNAKIRFKKSISIDPDFVLVKLRLADIYRFEGSNSKALSSLKILHPFLGKLSKSDSLRAIALENLLSGEYHEAIKLYNQILEFLPYRSEVYYDLAEAYFVVRDIKNAKKNYKKALDINSDFCHAINHYAYCFTHQGNHDTALKYFRKYLNLDSSANAYDSFGDGLMAAGLLDSAEWAKRQGLELDDKLDYLYNSMNYIQVRRGEFEEAEENVNRYIKLQKNPELLVEGYTNKALIYFSAGDYQKAFDTSIYAMHIFDTIDLVTRNHKLHWLLARIYLLQNNEDAAKHEVSIMKNLIENYNINQYNYNKIYKYYLHLKALLYKSENNLNKFEEIILIFDNELHDKVKDWSSPFDIAYFNTEFGKIFLELGETSLAKERFQKALEYNPNYALAHYYLITVYQQFGENEKESIHRQIFENLWSHADNEAVN